MSGIHQDIQVSSRCIILCKYFSSKSVSYLLKTSKKYKMPQIRDGFTLILGSVVSQYIFSECKIEILLLLALRCDKDHYAGRNVYFFSHKNLTRI